jgi:hypothetical protein
MVMAIVLLPFEELPEAAKYTYFSMQVVESTVNRKKERTTLAHEKSTTDML